MQYYGMTDTGMQRKENQDRIEIPLKQNDAKLFIVADGMGGANAGGVASKMAIEYIKNAILDGIEETNYEKENLEELIRKSIVDANRYVYNKAKENKDYSGMGTTVSVALIVKNKVYIGHIGDSRIYRIRKHIMRQLTHDHSYVQELVKNGTITKKEAETHPQKNILLKVLGCEPNVEPDVMVKGFIKEDILLLCSDGLTNMVDKDEIYEVVTNEKNKLENACNILVSEAKKNGGYDNISVILIFND